MKKNMLVSPQNCTTEYDILAWAIKLRQPVSLVVILLCAVILFTTPPSWRGNASIGLLMDMSGLALVVLAAFGRIWSSLYISGYKEDRVVVEGPYAIVRNPLYVCSFVGAIGLGLASRHLAVLGLVVLAFLLYYPVVVLAEERNLQRKFGQDYEAYRQRVPRFCPKRFPLVEPDAYPLRPRHVRRSLQEILWFFWSYLILHLAVVLQSDSVVAAARHLGAH